MMNSKCSVSGRIYNLFEKLHENLTFVNKHANLTYDVTLGRTFPHCQKTYRCSKTRPGPF